MNRFDHQWQKLITLARQAGDTRETGAPLGFATRLAAQGLSFPPGSPWAAFERFALRGLVVAAAFGVGAIVFNYSIPTSEPTDELAAADTVGDLLDLS